MRIGKRRIIISLPDALVLIITTLYSCYLFFQVRAFKNADLNLTLIRPVFYVYVVFLVIHLIRSVRLVPAAKEAGERVERAVLAEKLRVFWNENGKIVVIMASAVLYAFAMKFLGFFAATIIVLPLTMYLLGVKKLWLLAVITIATGAFFYLCFDLWLGVSLPAGELFKQLGLGA